MEQKLSKEKVYRELEYNTTIVMKYNNTIIIMFN